MFPDPARLKKVLIKLLHMRPTLNHILPKLAGISYLKPIDASSSYHKLKLDEESYLSNYSSIWQLQV